MAFYKHVEVTAERLISGDTVLLKDGAWKVVTVHHDERVTVERDGRRATGKCLLWTVRKSLGSNDSDAPSTEDTEEESTVDTSDYITVQTYLLGRGMAPERLETAAKTFGTVLTAQYRKRYGKQAKPPTQLEYVHYLDGDGEWAHATEEMTGPYHSYGWYESRCYGPQDRDLMDAVADARHPGLESFVDPCQRAVDVLREQFEVSGAELTGQTGGELLWRAERQIRECLASGQVCAHEACSRRRGSAWKGKVGGGISFDD